LVWALVDRAEDGDVNVKKRECGPWLSKATWLTPYAGRGVIEIDVENTSDHTIFVSSHFPFFEVNRRLAFDRALVWGMHLDIPAGDAVRWRPGEVRRVRLVAYGGRGVIRGFNPADGRTRQPRTPGRGP
jgi:urease beta subunit